MDLKNTGKIIAERRKEKKLTQKYIAEELGITEQSVSKWENGVNLPDMDKLKELCRILDLDMQELMNGESKEKNDKNKRQSIHTSYEKEVRAKYIFKLIMILLAIFSLLLLIYCVNNYSKVKIYQISSNDTSVMTFNGYLIYHPEGRHLILNNLNYMESNDKEEIKAKGVTIKVYYFDECIFNSKENASYNNDESIRPLNDILDTINIDVFKNDKNNLKRLKTNVVENLTLNIEYINEKNEQKKITVSMKGIEEFSNHKLFYQKG